MTAERRLLTVQRTKRDHVTIGVLLFATQTCDGGLFAGSCGVNVCGINSPPFRMIENGGRVLCPAPAVGIVLMPNMAAPATVCYAIYVCFQIIRHRP